MGYTDDALGNKAVSRETPAAPTTFPKKPESKKYFYDKIPFNELSPEKQRKVFRTIKKYFPAEWGSLKKKHREEITPQQARYSWFRGFKEGLRDTRQKTLSAIKRAQDFLTGKIEGPQIPGIKSDSKPESTARKIVKGVINTAGEFISGVADTTISSIEAVGTLSGYKDYKTLLANLHYTAKAIGNDFSINYPEEQSFIRGKNRAAHATAGIFLLYELYAIGRIGLAALKKAGISVAADGASAAIPQIPGIPSSVIKGLTFVKKYGFFPFPINSRLQEIADKARRQAVLDSPPVQLKGVKGAEETLPYIDSEGNIYLPKDKLEF